MENARLQELLKFHREDPSDPFLIYALATEYLKTDAVQAEAYYSILLKDHPDYLPVYYHAAKFYEAKADYNQAAALYKKGIQLSLDQKNMKTHRELMNALNEMELMNGE
ncbi:MAG: tetratricopeptide repeat protein [Cytophagaceae bacterium]